ncbi:SpoIID/LytB domain-containing protein [Sulfoacidibacillus thermotolerans]|uniref:Sporulation stage II protein D amidase enhancer LytB N-terminal domain-containing protein n=1 Tax=Sulfoacidibacillus thermotolerans TaxID=1765684 RepID=A0A2U3D929_SULT2|nr:SpoIID/LytB domain-containing protein [Sulfoacidibacillus thermotolerans]PWI57792.1 hypothetical protein BM613_06250 [Sulfoacidibacillus thermotolerans]
MKRPWIAAMALFAVLLWGGAVVVPSAHGQVYAYHTIYNTPLPSVIHVAIRANNDPRGQILWVQTVGFQEYCSDVLPNEWFSNWKPEALKAGAMAVKMFGWYHVLHPVTIDGFTFDVDNTTNFQEYKYMSGRFETDQAVRNIWPYAYVYTNGGIGPLDFRAGIPNNANWMYNHSQKMAQWGSEYLANAGMNYIQILGFYYTGRTLLQGP